MLSVLSSTFGPIAWGAPPFSRRRAVRDRPRLARPAGRARRRAGAGIAQRDDLPDLLARAPAGRGVEIDDVPGHLDPTVRALMPDPSVSSGWTRRRRGSPTPAMRGETVAIFGDYDVYGATSAATLARFLRLAGIDPIIHIPDRLFEGYGPNVEAIRGLAGRGATLLVTVDCGTVSHEPLAEAARLGMETIVIDHHLADETLPPALAVVNPNRLDDLSKLGHLAAVGLVFMTVVAVNRELRRRGFWTKRGRSRTCSTCSTWSRSAPSPTWCRSRGSTAPSSPRAAGDAAARAVGLTALMDVSRLGGPPEPFHLGFLLGPRINAGGRIGRASLGVDLLLADDPIEAARIAAELDRLNTERRAIEVATVAQAEAEAMAALGIEEKGAAVVTAAEGWHPGVVGLVAARLKERFGRPAFAIALEPGGIGTGSGRSIAGVDLGRVVRQAVGEGLLIKGGGHAMAAGVTLRKDALAAFRAFLEEHSARRSRPRGATTRSRSTARSRRRPRPPKPSPRSRRPGRSAPAMPSRWWRCRRIRSPMPTRSGRRT